MKRTERHHLKENELAHLAVETRRMIETKRQPLTLALIAVLVVGVAAGGYMLWKGRVNGRASAELAEAFVIEEARVGPAVAPGSNSSGRSYPTERERSEAALEKFKQVANEHASTPAGIEARYREAALLVTLGKPKEAATAYQLVIDRAGTNFLGQMARMGLAESQVRAGQFDQAIGIYNDLAQQKDERLVEVVLMQLGRAYREAGKRTEAEQTLNRLLAEYPTSLLAEDARRELEALKKG